MSEENSDTDHGQGVECPPETGQNHINEEMARLIESRLAQTLALPSAVPGWKWKSIMEGGSDRDFYRVWHPDGKSWIVMRYSTAREENALYPEIARFLRENHLNAPHLIFHDADLRLIVVEDLGEESLYSVFLRQAGPDCLKRLYQAALDQARLLHQHASAPVRMMNGFDEGLYRWERHYFLDNLVDRWAGIRLTDLHRAEIETEGEQMIAELMKTPLCLIHRDFQSQNLMVRGDSVWLIDFQGMRPGHASYDVASLLYDPYVKLDIQWRDSLLAWYTSAHEFEGSFHRAAVQRLMQALGAYSFLGLVKEKRQFLKYIPQGLENLEEALRHLEGMNRIQKLVQQIRVETKAVV